jgi:hypothetical protein
VFRIQAGQNSHQKKGKKSNFDLSKSSLEGLDLGRSFRCLRENLKRFSKRKYCRCFFVFLSFKKNLDRRFSESEKNNGDIMFPNIAYCSSKYKKFHARISIYHIRYMNQDYMNYMNI